MCNKNNRSLWCASSASCYLGLRIIIFIINLLKPQQFIDSVAQWAKLNWFELYVKKNNTQTHTHHVLFCSKDCVQRKTISNIVRFSFLLACSTDQRPAWAMWVRAKHALNFQSLIQSTSRWFFLHIFVNPIRISSNPFWGVNKSNRGSSQTNTSLHTNRRSNWKPWKTNKILTISQEAIILFCL